MRYSYTPKGVCSMQINFDINDSVITNIEFIGGCNGNLKAVAILCNGMTADEINNKLSGNTCGFKSTSCADQFAKAVMAAKIEEEKSKN